MILNSAQCERRQVSRFPTFTKARRAALDRRALVRAGEGGTRAETRARASLRPPRACAGPPPARPAPAIPWSLFQWDWLPHSSPSGRGNTRASRSLLNESTSILRAKQRERDTDGFAIRSFLIELIVAKLSDEGKKFNDYHVGLEHFFTYIQRTGLKERIAFSDNYTSAKLPKARIDVVEIFDPVNPDNNVASSMTESERRKIVEAAGKALDALAFAQTCQTKAEAVECWQDVMGSSFNP